MRWYQSTNTWVFTSTINWTGHITQMPCTRRGQSRLHLLRRLRSFGVCTPLLRPCYDTFVASALFHAVDCWGCGFTERDRKRLNKLVGRDGSEHWSLLRWRRMLDKMASIMSNSSDPLRETGAGQSISFRKRFHPTCKKERFRRSFIPSALRLYNTSVMKYCAVKNHFT